MLKHVTLIFLANVFRKRVLREWSTQTISRGLCTFKIISHHYRLSLQLLFQRVYYQPAWRLGFIQQAKRQELTNYVHWSDKIITLCNKNYFYNQYKNIETMSILCWERHRLFKQIGWLRLRRGGWLLKTWPRNCLFHNKMAKCLSSWEPVSLLRRAFRHVVI